MQEVEECSKPSDHFIILIYLFRKAFRGTFASIISGKLDIPAEGTTPSPNGGDQQPRGELYGTIVAKRVQEDLFQTPKPILGDFVSCNFKP